MEELELNKKKLVLIPFILIFLSVFIFSGYKIYKIISDYNEAEVYYTEFSDRFITKVTGNEISGGTASESSADSESDSKPAVPISVDFDGLIKYNSDIAGWLYCEDTVMNYPVAQSDDNDFYLRRSLDKTYLVTGTIFADFRCTAPGADKSYVIYGHDMKNGTIFGMLDNYESSKYMKAHPFYYYLTPNGNYRIDVYSGVVVNAADRLYNVVETDGYISYIKELSKSGCITDSFELTDTDNLLILSTCSDKYEDARFVLIGKVTLIP